MKFIIETYFFLKEQDTPKPNDEAITTHDLDSWSARKSLLLQCLKHQKVPRSTSQRRARRKKKGKCKEVRTLMRLGL
jgi:hypothetical protein